MIFAQYLHDGCFYWVLQAGNLHAMAETPCRADVPLARDDSQTKSFPVLSDGTWHEIEIV